MGGKQDSGANLRALGLAVLCACLLACTTIALIFCVGFREISWLAQAGLVQYAVSWLAVALVFVVGTWAGYRVLKYGPGRIEKASSKNPWSWMTLSFDKASILKAFAVIFICWIPFLILQYPCAMNEDAYNQLYQFQTSFPTYYTTLGVTFDASFIDHHPVFDTLVFGTFLALGDLLGSQNLGLFFYALTQSALAALVLAFSCCYLERLGVPKPWRLLCLAFCALFFIIPLWTATMVKDSLFAVFFVLFFLLYIEAFRSEGAAFERKGFIALFAATAVLCALTKKPGFYIVVLSLLVLTLFFVRKKAWKPVAAVLVLVPLVHSLLFPLLLYPAIGGVEPGGRQESLGFALQQVVTVMRGENDLSAEEQSAVDAVLDTQRALEKYNPASVDPVKNSVKPGASAQDYRNFLSAYVSIGVRHIPEYTFSVFSTSAAMLCPGVKLTYYTSPEQRDAWVERFEKADAKGELHLTFFKPEAIKDANLAFQKAFYTIADLPGFNVILSKGLFGAWIPIICIVLSLWGGRRFLVAYAPILFSVLLIILSPVVSTRYIIPLLFTTVLSLGLLCYALVASQKKGSGKHAA